MSDAYIRWTDVKIEEEIDSIDSFDLGSLAITSYWTAEFEGNVHQHGGDLPISEATVHFSRTGPTADGAAVALIEAAKAQGWEIL